VSPCRLVFVAECRSANDSSDFMRLAAEHARAAALDGSGISPDVVVLIKPRTLPKTTSGKVRRSGVKQVGSDRHVEPRHVFPITSRNNVEVVQRAVG
jgi:acyl-coenzyme A synthetase/AMP-(fatty) acid ligase